MSVIGLLLYKILMLEISKIPPTIAERVIAVKVLT